MSARREYRVWEAHEEQVGYWGRIKTSALGGEPVRRGVAAGSDGLPDDPSLLRHRTLAPLPTPHPPATAPRPAARQALRDGVKKHGLGAWEKIRTDPEFEVLRCDASTRGAVDRHGCRGGKVSHAPRL
jgi:hypothetical protein